MHSKPLVLAAVLALLAPLAPAQAAVGDFRLPEESAQQQPAPDRQGPVAPDVPESRRTPTPAPTPTANAPVPVIAPLPVLEPPAIEATPAPQATRAVPAPERTGTTSSPLVAAPVPSAAVPADDAAQPPLASPSPAARAPVVAAAPANADEPAGSFPWLWALGGILALGAAVLAVWAGLRLRRVVGPVDVPEIERPRIVPKAPPAPAPAPASAAPVPAATNAPLPQPAFGEPLQVTMEPLRLSLTLMNAALSWRLQVTNRGLAPLTALAIGADMISAHASMSREEQLSGPANGASAIQRIERLEPGESRTLEGEFRLPLGQIVPIHQGKAALLLPLARFRVEAQGAKPLVRTFAVGQPGNGSGLQPFRLDEGPRIYPRLAQKAFA